MVPAVVSLGACCLPGDAATVAKSLPGMGNARLETQFTVAYTKLEVLFTLGFMHHGAKLYGSWAPLGRYFFLNEERNRVLQEMRESIATMGDDSPFVRARIFGEKAGECSDGINSLVSFLGQIPRLGWV